VIHHAQGIQKKTRHATKERGRVSTKGLSKGWEGTKEKLRRQRIEKQGRAEERELEVSP